VDFNADALGLYNTWLTAIL